MQKNTLGQNWEAAVASDIEEDLYAQREAMIYTIGDALLDRIALSIPDDHELLRTVTAHNQNDYILEVSALDEDGVGQVRFKAGFDFGARLSWIENFAITTGRGQGLGRDLFAIFLKEASEKGFVKANLQSADIGSYFWLTQGVMPSETHGLIPKLDLRLDVLGKWLPPEPIKTAQALLAQVKENPQKLRDLARLDFRTEIAHAFASPDYASEVERRETEGWTNGFMDQVEVEIGSILKDRQADCPATLGHLLFVRTGWHGGIEIPAAPSAV